MTSKNDAPRVPPEVEHDAGERKDQNQDARKDFVRRVNGSFAAVYSLGGLAILICLVLYSGLNLYFVGFSALASASFWVGAVLLFLVGLFVLRIFVARRAFSLLAEIKAYCAEHQLDLGRFRAEFTDGDTFPFFESVFTVTERRLKLAEGGDAEAPNTTESPENP